MTHTWNFFRAGGFDQVQLDSGADLLALKDLDQKLWVALGCPTRGLEFDPVTLDLIDSDADGHVRANEVLEALAFAGKLLKNPDLLLAGADSLALTAIDTSSVEGLQVEASARHILKSLGKPQAQEISLADLSDIEKLMAGLDFNGDGVICPTQVKDDRLRLVFTELMQCVGSVSDLSGQPGVNLELTDKFFAEVQAYTAWQAKASNDKAIFILGENTQLAAQIFNAVAEKINDYFTRCQLAAYDARSAEPLSRSVDDYQRLAALSLCAQNAEVALFPLASIVAGKPLSLLQGNNPVWQARLDAFRNQVVQPLLGAQEILTEQQWGMLCDKFVAFAAWQSEKPAGNVEQLGLVRLSEIHNSSSRSEIEALIARDQSVAAEMKAVHLVEKLLRYHRDLYKLVNNFVSFRNFFTGSEKSIFQVGTLYLDGRSCELCIRVEEVARHAAAAASSGICLVYCDCVRDGGKQKMSIAAAFTAGDSDYLQVGRNGIFYDRKGLDWDATVVRTIDHPISLRQSFWSPYKKLSRMIGEQLQNLAASKASNVESQMLKTVVDSSKAVASPPKGAKPAFDVGKFAGIFAAIGLAIGAIGGVLASIVTGLLGLKFWQIPLAIFGLMLLISGPSLALAWFKLKRRHLAPLLDANGWAINARVYINIPFGGSLTALAGLPEGAIRSLFDPYAEKSSKWPYVMAIALGLVLLIGYMVIARS